VAKNKVRTAINKLCERIEQFNIEMAECQVAFTWKGNDLFALRTIDVGNGYAMTNVYQLGNEALIGLLSVDFDIDDDGEVDELFWDEIEQHQLVSFGE